MTSQQADLYSRIRALPFDGDGSSHRFEDRLADENGWSRAFTRRAIDEYRKFLLLAATAGHSVSPSDAVDQVWHLHLLYTRSYWDELCSKVLPRPLHHEPSTGGPTERAKFDDWYANTVESYRRTFECNPPADVWPAPRRAGAHAARHRRIDTARNWVLPRRGVAQAALAATLLLALLALASGCAATTSSDRIGSTAIINPLDLRGPQFLVLYFVAFGIALILAATIRSSVRGGATLAGDREDLDAYEVAYLRGGAREAAKVAVTRLVSMNLLKVNTHDGTVRAVTPAPAGLYPIEAAAHRAASPTLGTRVSQVCAAVRNDAERVGRRLRDRELIVDESRGTAAATLATLVALSVPAVGLLKILIGVSRDRPVMFLVIGCIATTVLALVLFARRPRRTRRGDAVLERLRGTHAALRRARLGTATTADLPLAVALFGFDSLRHTEYAMLRRTAQDPGSSFVSSCGGSGCGGSSGGGGGGCGGGGCGGCGG